MFIIIIYYYIFIICSFITEEMSVKGDKWNPVPAALIR